MFISDEDGDVLGDVDHFGSVGGGEVVLRIGVDVGGLAPLGYARCGFQLRD